MKKLLTVFLVMAVALTLGVVSVSAAQDIAYEAKDDDQIIADFTDETVSIENMTDHIVKTAFGKNETPTWSDFQNFLEERCLPRSRSGIREYLETIGVESYEPFEIIKKTNGRMAEDNQWLKWEVIE